jgi:hypothetical protein
MGLSDVFPVQPEGTATLTAHCEWWPLTFLVKAPDPEILRLVRAHFDCTFKPDAAVAEARPVSVRVVPDPVLLRRLDDLDETGVVRVKGFADEEWDFSESGGIQFWWRTSGTGQPQAVVRAGADEWYVAAVGRMPSALLAVRVCRELLRSELADRGALTVHGGLMATHGTGGCCSSAPAGPERPPWRSALRNTVVTW